ncbi:uncharacterized protein LOC142074601 [Calonectris borealis]|uniref:uncharacterized protein LOC142074601 n=1 Tax=Calonectris borealis TaxID=1323832 RepID=UPI003F4B6B57
MERPPVQSHLLPVRHLVWRRSTAPTSARPARRFGSFRRRFGNFRKRFGSLRPPFGHFRTRFGSLRRRFGSFRDSSAPASSLRLLPLPFGYFRLPSAPSAVASAPSGRASFTSASCFGSLRFGSLRLPLRHFPALSASPSALFRLPFGSFRLPDPEAFGSFRGGSGGPGTYRNGTYRNPPVDAAPPRCLRQPHMNSAPRRRCKDLYLCRTYQYRCPTPSRNAPGPFPHCYVGPTKIKRGRGHIT